MDTDRRGQDREIEQKRRWFSVGRELYSLPDDQIARVYDVAKRSGVDLDDAIAIMMFNGLKLGLSVETLELVARTLPSSISKAGREAADAIKIAAAEVIGDVTTAAVAQVQARHAELTRTVGDQVAEVAEDILREGMTTERRRHASRLAIAICLASTIALGVGTYIGSGMQAGAVNQMAAYAARPDASTWMQLMGANTDLRATLAAYCTPNATRYVRDSGGAVSCDVPLYLQAPPLPRAPGGGAGVISSIDVAIKSTSPYALLGIGAIVMLAVGFMMKGGRRPSYP